LLLAFNLRESDRLIQPCMRTSRSRCLDMSRERNMEIDQRECNWVWKWFQRTIQMGE